LVFIISIAIYSQQDTINKVDEKNLKQGYWVVKDETNNKIEEGLYKNDLKTGVWKSHYNDGTLKQEITYVDNKPDGYAKFYYPSGVVSEEGIWKGTNGLASINIIIQTGNLLMNGSIVSKANELGFKILSRKR